MEPELAQFESAYQAKINFVNIDVDKDSAKLDKHPGAKAAFEKEEALPFTALVDKQGKVLKTWVGAVKKADLERDVKPFLK